MTEAQLQTRFTRWLKRGGGFAWLQELGFVGAGFELKIVKGDSLPFSQVEEGQEIALMRARGVYYPDSLQREEERTGGGLNEFNGLAYKISDSAIGYKPFDCFAMWGCGAFIVCGYQGGARVVAVSIVDWMKHRVRMAAQSGGRGRGSLKLKDALRIGHEIDLNG